MPITIEIPTQQQLAQYKQDPGSLLAMWNAANQPKPAVGTPGAVTGAGGAGSTGGTSNLNALNNPEWITSMSEMINQINVGAQQNANNARIPGAAGLEAKSSENIQSALGGNVPNDVLREMAQRSAERGVSTGSPMGANSTADIMRALGLTSLDMTNLGQKQLTEALGRNPAAPLFNPAQLVTSAGDAEKLAIARENMMLDYNARMAEAAARSKSGYGRGGGSGGGSGGNSGGGGFAPATNWSGGGQAITEPWKLGQTKSQYWGSMAGSGWTPDTYTEPMNPLYGYTPNQGLPNSLPQDNSPSWDSWNNLLPEMNGGGINDAGMSQEELDWLYNVGG